MPASHSALRLLAQLAHQPIGLQHRRFAGAMLGVAILLAEHAAAVFLHIKPQRTRLLLSVLKNRPEIAIEKFHAEFLRSRLGGAPQQLMVLIGADEQCG